VNKEMTDPEFIAGMGEIVVNHNPAILISLGLGSCVGVCIWCEMNHKGGLAHVMLSDSHDPNLDQKNEKNFKYADIAIGQMIEMLINMGCPKSQMTAKIAGGAHMFQSLGTDVADIGRRNVEAVKKKLASEGIKLLQEDVFGNEGRTIRFDLKTGMVNVKTKSGIHEI
jgi:chemotaxis protein CheD